MSVQTGGGHTFSSENTVLVVFVCLSLWCWRLVVYLFVSVPEFTNLLFIFSFEVRHIDHSILIVINRDPCSFIHFSKYVKRIRVNEC